MVMYTRHFNEHILLWSTIKAKMYITLCSSDVESIELKVSFI